MFSWFNFNKMFSFIFYSVLFLQVVVALKLPKYITPCNRESPDLDECGTLHGRQSLPHIIKGDRKYKIPSFSPLRINELVINQGHGGSVGLKFVAKDLKIYGLDKSQLDQFKMDTVNKVIYVQLSSPIIQSISQYKVEGRILVLPVNGQGVANITAVDVKYNTTIFYEIYKKDDGKEYLRVTDAKVIFDTGRSYLHLDGLFNNDRFLGAQMNNFLNDNWREALKELGPAISESIRQVTMSIIDNISGLVPYDELFPPGQGQRV